MKKYYFVFFSLAVILQAQNKISLHQSESDYYSRFENLENINAVRQSEKIFKIHSAGSLKKTVIGFLPWWEYASGSYNNLRYDLLTHIAVAFFQSDGEGNLSSPPYWPWTNLINRAKNNNIKLVMSVSNFDPAQIHKLLTVNEMQDKLFAEIADTIRIYNFAGINIDFENLLASDRGTLINNFMKSLGDYLKSLYNVEVSFDSPAVNNGGWDFTALSNSCDYLFVMGYDFYGSSSTTTGPSAPLTGAVASITNSFKQYYGNVQSDKLILGVPYYGNYWRTDSQSPYASVTPYDSARSSNDWVAPVLRYNEIIPKYSSGQKMWDIVSGTPWIRWQDTRWNQIWYDDENSLSDKLNFALTKKLKGIGIWALGYDDGRTELWNAIESKLVTGIEKQKNSLPDKIILHQNFPNPFNPSTVISFELPAPAFVSLNVYDQLGRKVAALSNGFQQAGLHKFVYDIKNMSSASGIYFYILSDGINQIVKKMIFLK